MGLSELAAREVRLDCGVGSGGMLRPRGRGASWNEENVTRGHTRL